MSRLDNASDWLSPIVVKELRQVVRGREFNYSLGLGLIAGLLVAFLGSFNAETGDRTAGVWVFGALTTCLAFIGIVVAPLATFNSLRKERLARTLELVTLTSLSPRRLVVGKLMAQSVKLVTLFAALAPFVAMSFLLGGIDFVTILISLAALLMWSLWACAASLFLSCFTKGRAVSAVLLAGVFMLFLLGAMTGIVVPLINALTSGGSYAAYSMAYGSGSAVWFVLGGMVTFFVITIINLILLAENRLSLPTEDRTTALRIGFLIQFLLILAWTLIPTLVAPASFGPSDAAGVLTVLAGIQLAAVAIFSVTEELVPSRRVLRRTQGGGRREMLLAIFRPGGASGAAYVLAQMALMLALCFMFLSVSPWVIWPAAVCCYVLAYTGLPVFFARRIFPNRFRAEHLRVGIFLLFPIVMLLPDFLYFVVFRSPFYELEFSARHVLNPFRTFDNWSTVQGNGWDNILYVMGVLGGAAYLALIKSGRSAIAAERASDIRPSGVHGNAGSGN